LFADDVKVFETVVWKRLCSVKRKSCTTTVYWFRTKWEHVWPWTSKPVLWVISF